MTPCMSLYHGDGGSNNDLTSRKYVMYTIVHTKWGLDHSILAVYVSPTDRVSM